MVKGPPGVNRMGVGSLVKVSAAGQGGASGKTLGAQEIRSGYGWCAGHEAVAHFGLGQQEKVDIEVILPWHCGTLFRKGVAANQRVTIE
jgi:hypothetical protein